MRKLYLIFVAFMFFSFFTVYGLCEEIKGYSVNGGRVEKVHERHYDVNVATYVFLDTKTNTEYLVCRVKDGVAMTKIDNTSQ